ncbi:hypothetical protein APY04_2360 [Hyphomicrobium sulfonivorans]|uniref:Uncharacterized protein n=1 Tax=Hyphomicrobium sulfonivorans TaxID=121290 RepID=A0A120CUF5_HYPSL|nr:hypothetical protein APY04_2360 [Hyphomicrobium sulfonivorans]
MFVERGTRTPHRGARQPDLNESGHMAFNNPCSKSAIPAELKRGSIFR